MPLPASAADTCGRYGNGTHTARSTPSDCLVLSLSACSSPAFARRLPFIFQLPVTSRARIPPWFRQKSVILAEIHGLAEVFLRRLLHRLGDLRGEALHRRPVLALDHHA